MKIVHIITNDKFTNGYINFMKSFMKEYEHFYLVAGWSKTNTSIDESTLVDTNNVIRYGGVELIYSSSILALLKESDLIVISGCFGFERMIYSWPQYLFKKVYFHLWGGDFYQVRNKISWGDTVGSFHRHQLLKCFEWAKGLVFLIDGEYEAFKQITGLSKKNHFVAPMPEDIKNIFPYEEYRNYKVDEKVRIIVGNSATCTNNHEEAFSMLSHLKNEDIQIICPLSYGDKNYAEHVEQIGISLFGNKITFLKEMMTKFDYYKLLASCDVGVFNNDRQQAMGNIQTMLFLGKKVYMRTDIPSYKNFESLGFTLFDIFTLKASSLEDILSFNERDNNISKTDIEFHFDDAKKKWNKVFASINK